MTQFKDHFSTVAVQYAAFRPRYALALFDYLAGLCAARELAWDCACGSGQASLPLADRFNRVVATDASAKQIESAEAHPRVQYRVAPAEQSGLERESVDLITVAQALHWFDHDRFYSEALRVLKPNGVLAAWTYGFMTVEGDAVDREIRALAAEIDSYWPPERRLVDTGYRTLDFPFAEIEPPAFSLEEQWPLDHLLGYVSSFSATSRYIAQKGVDPVPALRKRLLPLWGNPNEPRRISWPLTMRVGRKS